MKSHFRLPIDSRTTTNPLPGSHSDLPGKRRGSRPPLAGIVFVISAIWLLAGIAWELLDRPAARDAVAPPARGEHAALSEQSWLGSLPERGRRPERSYSSRLNGLAVGTSKDVEKR